MNAVQLSQETITKEQAIANQKRDKLTRLSQVFSRANSVLTSRLIKVHVVDDKHKNAPAWSGASDVYFNMAQVRDEFDAQSLLSLQGLNFHELAHVRYTPRNGTEICRWVIENDKWQAFNALEDMRIEGLLVSRFPSVANWLTATILDYLVREEKALTTLYALVRGRRYLPIEVRTMARENYANQSDLDELCDVVDSYRTLLFPEDTEVAKELITRYHNLLQNLPIIDNGNGSGSGDGEGGEGTTVEVRIYDPNGHASRPTQGVESSNSRPAPKSEQLQDRDNLPQVSDSDETKVAKSKPDVVVEVSLEQEQSTPQSTTPQPSDVDDVDDVDDDFDDEFDFDDDEFGDDSDSDSDKSDSNADTSGGNGIGTGTDDVAKDNQVINDLLDEIVDELSKELDRLSVQVNGSPLLLGNGAKEPDKANYNEVPVPEDLYLVSKSFAKELERLRANHDPAWNKQVDSGRLNVTRYLNGDDFDTVFDEWQEGRDDVTAIEAVILLDYSGSMGGTNANNAYQSMWAIKKSLEQVNARTTVVLFDHNTKLLYGADEKAGKTIRDAGANGGTDPEEALLYAQNVLANSEQPIKMLFMITDGHWDSAKGEEAVRTMKQSGVLTCQSLIGFGSRDLEPYRHSFELLAGVENARSVLSLGKDLVRLAIARQLVTR